MDGQTGGNQSEFSAMVRVVARFARECVNDYRHAT
jgi:hypothetical protein